MCSALVVVVVVVIFVVPITSLLQPQLAGRRRLRLTPAHQGPPTTSDRAPDRRRREKIGPVVYDERFHAGHSQPSINLDDDEATSRLYCDNGDRIHCGRS